MHCDKVCKRWPQHLTSMPFWYLAVRWLDSQSFFQLALRVFAVQPLFQASIPIGQSGVVTGDQVSENGAERTVWLVELLDCPECPSGGMGLVTSGDFAFDMRILPIYLADVALETGTIFAKVMP